MLIEIYLLLQVVVVGLFLTSFFTKQEILWTITLVLSALMMFSSYNIEKNVPVFNATLSNSTFAVYDSTVISYSYPYLMGLNAVFFGLALVLAFFDMFDKYRKSKQED
jgi:hypothetical protein